MSFIRVHITIYVPHILDLPDVAMDVHASSYGGSADVPGTILVHAYQDKTISVKRGSTWKANDIYQILYIIILFNCTV